MTADDLHSIWLVPAEPEFGVLHGRIRSIARARGAPAFLPHVTLLGDVAIDGETLAAVLERHAARLETQSLAVTGIRSGDSFFKALYLDLACPPELAAMRDALERDLPPSQTPGPFLPHVSMAYGCGDEGTRDAERLALEPWLGRDIGFDRLHLVRSAQCIPIDDWQVVDEFPLGFAGSSADRPGRALHP